MAQNIAKDSRADKHSDPAMAAARAVAPRNLIARSELKGLMRRRDAPGLVHLAALLLVHLGTAVLVYATMGTPGLLPAMAVHGFVLVHLFSLQHECSHGTAFRIRWINDWVARYCGIIICLPPRYFQLEHTQHHSYTQSPDYDPERIDVPTSVPRYLLYLSALPYWWSQVSGLIRHAAGFISEAETRFLEPAQGRMVIRESKIMLAIYAAVLVTSIGFGWVWPLYFWLIPLLLGEPAMRFIRMTEHVARPQVTDLTQNTRTCRIAWPLRFLCWNMNYHAEHHVAPSVPFHALPALHDRIGTQLPVCRGYWDAHQSIWRAVVA